MLHALIRIRVRRERVEAEAIRWNAELRPRFAGLPAPGGNEPVAVIVGYAGELLAPWVAWGMGAAEGGDAVGGGVVGIECEDFFADGWWDGGKILPCCVAFRLWILCKMMGGTHK